jgi:hypothetical protein
MAAGRILNQNFLQPLGLFSSNRANKKTKSLARTGYRKGLHYSDMNMSFYSTNLCDHL